MYVCVCVRMRVSAYLCRSYTCVGVCEPQVTHLSPPVLFPFPGPLTAHFLLSTSAVNQLYPVIQLAFPAFGATPTDPNSLDICRLVRQPVSGAKKKNSPKFTFTSLIILYGYLSNGCSPNEALMFQVWPCFKGLPEKICAITG